MTDEAWFSLSFVSLGGDGSGAWTLVPFWASPSQGWGAGDTKNVTKRRVEDLSEKANKRDSQTEGTTDGWKHKHDNKGTGRKREGQWNTDRQASRQRYRDTEWGNAVWRRKEESNKEKTDIDSVCVRVLACAYERGAKACYASGKIKLPSKN